VKRKAFIKRSIDAAMLLLLPVLMAEILTGQQAHEWLGSGMVLLFVLHHILNFGRMRNLFKEKYSPLRCAGSYPKTTIKRKQPMGHLRFFMWSFSLSSSHLFNRASLS